MTTRKTDASLAKGQVIHAVRTNYVKLSRNLEWSAICRPTADNMASPLIPAVYFFDVYLIFTLDGDIIQNSNPDLIKACH